jgi:hypothetical protein
LPLSSLPKSLMLLIALVQGLALLLLHQAIALEFWPQGRPHWLFGFYALAFVCPTMLLLSLEQGRVMQLLRWILPYGLLVTLLGFYLGWQANPLGETRLEGLLWAMVLTLGVASFKALIYIQQRVSGEAFTYSQLFRYSWRNFLTLMLSLFFALCVWGLLMLWAGLFRAIKINFFHDIFTERWFYYPALALAQGFGVIIFRQQQGVIDTITRIQQALMKFLLILLVFVSLLFLVTLPFTGLQPLWETGWGSGLILWMQALMLFFVNAVYQDEPDQRPYPLWLHRFISLGVAFLPVFSAIAFYGLSLRVGQYGWTVGRCWGFVIWGLLALFSLGYLWGLLRLRDRWLERLSWVNVRMGLVVMAIALLSASPLLDFRKISLASQLQRVEQGKIAIDELDFRYFYRQLARPGYLALERIKSEYAESRPELVLKIEASDHIYRRYENSAIERETFSRSLRRFDDQPLPQGLEEALHLWAKDNQWRFMDNSGLYLQPVDLNADGTDEYLLVTVGKHQTYLELFVSGEKGWQQASLHQVSYRDDPDTPLPKLLEAGAVEVVPPGWQRLKIGERIYQLQEESLRQIDGTR